jgi:hypothetical protein
MTKAVQQYAQQAIFEERDMHDDPDTDRNEQQGQMAQQVIGSPVQACFKLAPG